jgi:hypothetical protein
MDLARTTAINGDPVLDPGVGPMAYLQLGELPDDGVGGEGLEPLAVDVGEPQLCSGVRTFLPHDHA